MAARYNAHDWIVDALSATLSIHCMPSDMQEIIKDPSANMNIDFNKVLKEVREVIKVNGEMNQLGTCLPSSASDLI